VLYDGVCGLCNRLLQFLLKHDRAEVFAFAALQSDAGKMMVSRSGGDPDDLTSFYVVADFRTARARVLTRSDAAVFVASQLGWPWRLLRMARWLPASVRNWLYDLVARNRYRIFGRYDRCLLPGPEHQCRFVE
jgi:predicted DCC family thiol-disulfide oxidoreductase YuxK